VSKISYGAAGVNGPRNEVNLTDNLFGSSDFGMVAVPIALVTLPFLSLKKYNFKQFVFVFLKKSRVVTERFQCY
jgi:hypothetical protein